jgi:hypothetical protein
MAWEHDEEQCPLVAVDRRLEDVHRFWHQAEKAYFDPDGFRVAIQTAIQMARTVTFVLQKNKELIPDFDNWYEGWQKKLGANPLMKWMVDARNRIEKQGDLEAHSFVSAEIVISHLDEGPRIQVPAKLSDAPLALLGNIPANALGEHVKRDGILRIRRRWIENTLPDRELLDAVADAYGQLSQLVRDAHRQMGLLGPITTDADTGQQYPEGDRVGRMPCMIGHEDLRTLNIWLATGQPLEFEEAKIEVDMSKASVPQERYGVDPRDMYANNGEPHDNARALFSAARRIFEKDGYHVTIFIFLREGKPAAMPRELRPEEHGHKYIMMRSLAHEARRIGADAVFLIGESWTAPYDPAHPYRRAADSPDRREMLTATVVSRDGEPLQLSAEILRENGKVSLSETREHVAGVQYAFAPFYEVWSKPIPTEWVPAGRTSDTAGER